MYLNDSSYKSPSQELSRRYGSSLQRQGVRIFTNSDKLFLTQASSALGSGRSQVPERDLSSSSSLVAIEG